MAARMTDEERQAVVERLYAVHLFPPADGPAPLVTGVLFDNGTVKRVSATAEKPCQWPDMEAFVRWATAEGAECDVLERFGDGELGFFTVVALFPDGVVANLAPRGELGRRWPSLAAFLEEAAGRLCYVYRWHSAPSGGGERPQADSRARDGCPMVAERKASAQGQAMTDADKADALANVRATLRQDGQGVLYGVVCGDGRQVRILQPEPMEDVVPGLEAFEARAQALGLPCILQDSRIGRSGRFEEIGSALVHPDGTAVEIDTGRTWSSVEAFEKHADHRGHTLVYWRPAPAPEPKARPTDAETARRLRGTGGRLFVPAPDGRLWLDTETGAVGQLAELVGAWTAEPKPVP